MSQTWDVTLIPADPDAPAAYVERRGAPRGEITVRLQALDGAWETCGADRARGVWPENVKGLRADGWGSKSVGFDLRRDPKSIWPDISAFTPVQIDVDGVHRWTGRVAQTPVRDDLDSVISVQCEGLQAHLDDDEYERVYVHTKLADWKDQRASLATTLGSVSGGFVAAPQVNAGDGGITLQWPKDETIVAGRNVGVFLDLGPYGAASRVVVTWEGSNGDANNILFCRGTDDCNPTAGGDDAFTAGMNAGGPYTSNGTFSVPRRYVHLLFNRASADATASSDCFFRITSVQVFSDAAWETGNSSVLQSDDVVLDALNRATILLSPDRTLVDAGTFNIPEFAPAEPKTPRQVWEAVDAFEDRLKKIDLLGRAVYRAKSSVPRAEVGAWSAMSFEDASANDGSEVYSRAIVKGTLPDGTALRVERSQAQQPGAPLYVPASPTPDNPTFASNTTGWTATGSTITRDTGTFDTTPASGRWDNTGASDSLGAGDTLSTTFSGTFLAGVPYTLTFAYNPSSASGKNIGVRFGTATDRAIDSFSTDATGWQTAVISWTPTASRTGVTLTLTANTGAVGYLRIDSLALFAAGPTIVDRRGFKRTKTLDVSFALTTLSATRLADLWLQAHQRTPFKGTVKLTGTGAARDPLTGTPLPVAALLDLTGEVIRFTDRIDPDTGAVGRDARIAEVSIDPDTDEATVTLDNTRAGFDALLSRLDLVLGQGR